jgi:hypothetical protein
MKPVLQYKYNRQPNVKEKEFFYLQKLDKWIDGNQLQDK